MLVIEAMSYGKPVVGFDVGGHKYTIEEGINGYSVKEKDWGEINVSERYGYLLGG
jgi:glycosyltransferase involved in cell wall biosynthesis